MDKGSIRFPDHRELLSEIILDFELPDEVIVDPRGHLFCWVCRIPIDTKKGVVEMHIRSADHIGHVYEIAPSIEHLQSLRKMFSDAVVNERFTIMARKFGGPSERVDLVAFRNFMKSLRGLTSVTQHKHQFIDGPLSCYGQNDLHQKTLSDKASPYSDRPQEGSPSNRLHCQYPSKQDEDGRDEFCTSKHGDCAPLSRQQGPSSPYHSQQPRCRGTPSQDEDHLLDENNAHHKAHLHNEFPRNSTCGTYSLDESNRHDEIYFRGETYIRGEARICDKARSQDEVPRGGAHLHDEVYRGRFQLRDEAHPRDEVYIRRESNPHARGEPYPSWRAQHRRERLRDGTHSREKDHPRHGIHPPNEPYPSSRGDTRAQSSRCDPSHEDHFPLVHPGNRRIPSRDSHYSR